MEMGGLIAALYSTLPSQDGEDLAGFCRKTSPLDGPGGK